MLLWLTVSWLDFVGLWLGKPIRFLKLFCSARSKTSSAGSPFISLSGPETAQALSQNLSGLGERNASSITGAGSTGFSFYQGGGQLLRPGPLSLHIRVPASVIWLASTKTLFHFHCFSFFLSFQFIFISEGFFPDFFPPPSALCRSITFLTSNEERVCFENSDVMLRLKLQMKCTFWR